MEYIKEEFAGIDTYEITGNINNIEYEAMATKSKVNGFRLQIIEMKWISLSRKA